MKKIFLLLSFIIPSSIFFFFSFFEYGDSFLFNFPDVQLQYIPLFKWLSNILNSSQSFYYSFFKGLGGSMFATFWYYLSSPLNILFLFSKNILLVLNLLAIIKIGLCGLCMYIFLGFKNNKSLVSNLLFSLCYSLMGFNLIYINNIFWFDVVYIAPIVFLGIDKILEGKRPFIYILSLSYAIICNFYLSFSLCIFSVIYYLYNSIIEKKFNKINFFRFLLISLLTGVSCSFFLFPTLCEIFNTTSRTDINSFFEWDYLNIPYLFYKVLIGSNSINSYKYIFNNCPVIYCSVLVFLLNILYVLNKKVSSREKIIVLLIYVFFILSMVFFPLYKFWHAFSDTNGNFYRFSYLWSFFNIYIAYKSFNQISHKNYSFSFKSLFLIIFTFYLIIIFLFLSESYQIYYDCLEIILSFIVMIIYIVLIFIKKEYLIFFLIIELSINIFLTYNTKKTNYLYNNCPTLNMTGNLMVSRVEWSDYNYGLYCNLGSISSYYSTTNSKSNIFFKKSGLLSHIMYLNSYNYTTDLLYDLFSFRYLFFYDHFEYNDDALSVGFMVNYDYDFSFDNEILFQQELLNSMIDNDLNYFNMYTLYGDDYNYFFLNNSNTKYLLINDDNNSLISILTDSNKDSTSLYRVFYKVLRINDYSDDRVDIDLSLNCNLDDDKCIPPKLELYEIDDYSLNKAINNLKEQQLNVTKMEKNILEGNINVKSDNQYLFLSIPYEKGWSIYVDGEKVEYEKLYDAFIGIKLEKGYHDIKMTFYPPGLKLGIIISIGSTIFLIVYLSVSRRRIK